MATNILMPALSPTMTEGTLSRWLKKEGENVRAGDVIAEIETDKATMEVEAVDEGVLGKILVPDGTEGVKVNEPIAILVEQGEAVPAAAPAAPHAAPAPRRPQPAPAAAQAQPAAQPPPQPPRPAPHRAAMGTMRGGERIFASPLARRMAKQAGHRSGGAEGQRAERAHRQGGHRGGAAERPPRLPQHRSRAAPASRAGRAPAGADHRAAQAGAAQLDPEGDRAPADRGEIHHPAFLRLDGYRDRRDDAAAERAERASRRRRGRTRI